MHALVLVVKAGFCPFNISNACNKEAQNCSVDADCSEEQKCCYSKKCGATRCFHPVKERGLKCFVLFCLLFEFVFISISIEALKNTLIWIIIENIAKVSSK